MRPRHPAVEGVVQEEIGKYRADHATLRGAARPRYEFPVFFHRRCQPSLDVEHRPFALHVPSHRFHEQIVRQVVEQSFDVEFQNPVISPTSLARDADSV